MIKDKILEEKFGLIPNSILGSNNKIDNNYYRSGNLETGEKYDVLYKEGDLRIIVYFNDGREKINLCSIIDTEEDLENSFKYCKIWKE